MKETTNREGFVEDSFYTAFKQILNDSIRRINKNRKKLNDEMREYLKQAINTTADVDDSSLSFEPVIEKVKDRLEQTYDQTNANAKLMNNTLNQCEEVKKDIQSIPLIPEDTVSKFEYVYNNIEILSKNYDQLLSAHNYLTQQIETISYDFEKANERLQDLFELAGLGISVEMFSHEFDASIRSIRTKNNAFISKANSATIDELLKHINYVNYALDVLRKQMSYFNPGLKFVRSEKQTFSFKQFITEHKSFYSERCSIDGINYEIQVKEDFGICVNRGMLNQVFDNLFNNSEYWLNFSRKHGYISQKEYNIEVNNKGYVLVWDNGIGIGRDIENRLFEPFESKKENGRGLGLYIVASNLKYNSASIRLLQERNPKGNLYKFEINLLDIVQ